MIVTVTVPVLPGPGAPEGERAKINEFAVTYSG